MPASLLHRLRPLAALSPLALALVACAPATEVVVVVDTDLAVPAEVDRFAIDVSGATLRAVHADARLGEHATLPQTLGIVPADDAHANAGFTVRATAYHGDQVVVQREVTTAFVPGSTLRLELGLYALCRGVTCGPQRDCGQRGCESQDATTLPAWTGAATPHATPAPVLSGFFPIGVQLQPSDSFGAWTARGVNTFVIVPQDTDAATWSGAATAAGLFMVRDALASPAMDTSNGNVLAWSIGEELDAVWPDQIATVQANAQALRQLDPQRPTYTLFRGDMVDALGDGCDGPDEGTPAAGCYAALVAAADWIAVSSHPIALGVPQDLALVGRALDKVARWAPTQLRFASVETGNYQVPAPFGPQARAVTAPEVRAEVWEAVIHGARGIWYFPLQFPYPQNGMSFEFDGTANDVAGEITRQNALLTQLAPVLQGPVNPPEVRATAPAPLELGWRRDARGTTYVLALNLPGCDVASGACPDVTGVISLRGPRAPATVQVVGEGRTTQLAADGTITDHFAPDEVHVYAVP